MSLPRYTVREKSARLCGCGQTLAGFELLDPDGAIVGDFCSACAEQVRDDMNASLDHAEDES
jgi:hypothetical protein